MLNLKRITGDSLRDFFSRDPSPRFQRICAGLIVFCIIAHGIYLLISAWAFNTDDAYISLRYARHLAEGHGIVWNIGEYPPVEGYTNFLFVILGAGGIYFGLDPLLILKIFSSCSLGMTCVALYRIARLWVGPVGATFPALILTSYTGMIFWTVSGLETAVYQMFVTWAVLVFIKSFGFRPLPMSKDADTSIKKVSSSSLAISGFLVFLASIRHI